MNNAIKALMNEAISELAADKQKEKLCLIQDIIKAKQLLYGMDIEAYLPVVVDPAAEFDRLYDLELETLKQIDADITAEVNKTIQSKFKKL